MNFFNKFKKEKSDEKVFLNYKNGKVIKSKNEDEYLEKSNNLEEEAYQESKTVKGKGNMKSKLFTTVGLLMIIIPLVFIFIKSDANYFGKIKDYMATGKLEETPNENKPETEINIDKNTQSPNKTDKEDDKETSNKEENIKSISPETLIDFNNYLNKTMTDYYKYLKIDIVNYCNGKESVYSTNTNISYKRKAIYDKYTLLSEQEANFIRANQKELFDIMISRYANYVNTIDSMLSDLSRTSSINIFNESLEQDNTLLNHQISSMEAYLNGRNFKYTINLNEIIRK